MTADTRSLLVELFVEELPPKALQRLGDVFAETLAARLEQNDFLESGFDVTPFASPRRLAALVTQVRSISQPRSLPPAKLMPAAIGLDAQARPTAALLKRVGAASQEAAAQLWTERGFVADEGGRPMLFLRRDGAAGSHLHVALQGFIEDALQALPIPKVMGYQLQGDDPRPPQPGWTSVRFVRPAHGLVVLHGNELIENVHVLGLRSRRSTLGHRFESRVEKVVLRDADAYAAQLLEDGAVIASFEARRAEVARQLAAAAAPLGLTPVDDPALLDEVTALVERPNVLTCAFEPEFLAVPAECLVLTMKANQKYFPLLDGSGRLTHRFLVVANVSPDDASAVIQGNERVVRPRLADARFFFEQDRKRPLADRVAGLDRVVYHAQLGTQGARVQRVRAIARAVAQRLGDDALVAAADRAALLAKADLLTDMVGEFPELQGVMGGYYARHDGEPEAVAAAVEDHYRPRFAGDALPRETTGLVVALADKLETLAGLFAIGQQPSGDRDPFALRRHALGVVRMLTERALPLDLPDLLERAFAPFEAGPAARAALAEFIWDRQRGVLRDEGWTAHEIDAVLALRPPRLAALQPRLAAVRAFAALPEAAALAAANKRVGNILKKSAPAAADGAGAAAGAADAGSAAPGAAPRVDPARLVEPAERALHEALGRVGPAAQAAFDAGDPTGSLQALAALKAPVDAFFDAVMVNVEDAALRANRLALLGEMHRAMNRVADLSRLAA